MKLTESCESWTLEFQHNNLESKLTDEHKDFLKNIMHTTGDSLSVILGMPIEEEELRGRIIEAITSIYLDARRQIQMAVELTIMNSAITSPLQKGFTDEELYGENLTEALRASLKSEEEFGIADEYLSNEEDEDEEETD